MRPRRTYDYTTLARALSALAALTLTLAVVPGCTLLGDRTPLDDTSWRLVGWSVSSIDPGAFTITAQFDNGDIGGTSAVNSYGGEYRTGPGNDFSVGEIAQTLMAGPEEDMQAEAVYHDLLRAAASYRLNGTTLTLFDADGNESLVFIAAPR
ncbi:MAG: META domain-containing protein [Anaerosomatales bacterium]|nr:META domain-containing protein [Anaerosomatales bacterium]MDT8434172.1 META domain-containing protein [Anaerosomatales bacterium]